MNSLDISLSHAIERIHPKMIHKEAFTCNKCFRTYKSYLSYHFHSKKAHNNKSITSTTNCAGFINPSFTPYQTLAKIPKDFFVISPSEQMQDDLAGFLAETLASTAFFGYKPTLANIAYTINQVSNSSQDAYLTNIKTRSQQFFEEREEDHLQDLYLEFETEFSLLDPTDSLLVLVWVMFWLGKYYVKDSFIPDMCVIFSRIWKVMKEDNVRVEELGDELVWKKMEKECEPVMRRLRGFRGDKELVYEFLMRVCRLINVHF